MDARVNLKKGDITGAGQSFNRGTIFLSQTPTILVYQSLFNIGSGKMELSIFVTYVGLVHFQGSNEK